MKSHCARSHNNNNNKRPTKTTYLRGNGGDNVRRSLVAATAAATAKAVTCARRSRPLFTIYTCYACLLHVHVHTADDGARARTHALGAVGRATPPLPGWSRRRDARARALEQGRPKRARTPATEYGDCSSGRARLWETAVTGYRHKIIWYNIYTIQGRWRVRLYIGGQRSGRYGEKKT